MVRHGLVLLLAFTTVNIGYASDIAEPSVDTLTVAYPLKEFPYSWREIKAGKFDITPVRWTRGANNPLLKDGMNARPVWWNRHTIRVFYGVRGRGHGIYYFDVDPRHPDRIKAGPVGPIIQTGPVGSYDDDWLIAPEPVRLSNVRLRMYYSSKTSGKEFFKQAWSLSVADSIDNGKTWSKYVNNPVLTTGNLKWESGAVGFCSVRKEFNEWKMWYLGTDEKAVKQIGFATSIDGLHWRRDANNPIFPIDPKNYWESMAVAVPRVIRDGRIYKMWYCSFGPGNLGGHQGPYAIGFAESIDGLHWFRSPYNPVVKGSGKGWDSQMAEYPGVVRYRDRYYMWYSGSGYNGIGFAQAMIPRGSMEYRVGPSPEPNAHWSAWRSIKGGEPPRTGYIQFAVLRENSK